MKNAGSPRTARKFSTRIRLIIAITTFSLLVMLLGINAFMQTSKSINALVSANERASASVGVTATAGTNALMPVGTVKTVCNTGTPDFSTLSAAITDLNTNFLTGNVTYDVCAGFTETAPAGGYVITATGSAGNDIILEKSGAGANPTITAGLQAAGGSVDAVFMIKGGDFITIQGFTMQENAANLVTATGATNTMTEFGVGILHASATDGAQNNTIQNNIITLSSVYPNTVGIFSSSSTTSTAGSPPSNTSTDATSTAGTNSNNKIYGNNISSVAFGIMFVCPPITSTIFESGNDIGGTSAATANTITYGNNTASTAPWNRTSAASGGIVYRNGAGNSIRFNTVNTISNLTIASTAILISSGTAPTGVTYTSTISNNAITMTNTGTTAITGVDFGHGISTGTIVGSNNNVTLNQSSTAANAAAVIGIKANYTSATNTCSSNTVVINQSETTGAMSSAPTGITLAGTGTTLTGNSNNVTINQTGSGTGTISSTTIAIDYSGAATTINSLLNTVLVNQTTSVVSGNTTTITGIKATTASTTVNVGSTGNGNSITVKQGATGAGTYGTNAVTYINVNATHGTVNVVENNLLTTSSTIRTAGALIGVFQDSTVTVAVNVLNNTMNIDRVATSGSVNFQATSGTPSEVKDTISNNNITFTNLAGSTSAVAISSLGGPSSPAVNNKTINGNTINISGTNGTSTGISCGFTNTGFIQNNSITINTAATTTTGITTTGTAMTISGNTLNLSTSSTAATAMQGINETGGGAHSITNNTFSAMNFTGIVTFSPTVSGIAVSGGTGANIFGNTVTNISMGAATSSGSPTIDGILISGGTSINVFKNKIHGITTAATGTTTIVSGIRLSAGTANNVFNNLIGNLAASAAASTDAIRGINITSTTASSTNNIYYNTVLINAALGGANFGTTGIFHTINTTPATATLNLRNNVIVNTSIHNGTGLTVAYRRSGGAASNLANYASTSNNNDFYAGTPGASNLIYSDGVSSAQTMTAYKNGVFTAGTIAPRDSASFSENPTFLSTVGSNANFLHIDPTVATQLESGAVNIAGITDDFDAQTRQGNAGYSGTGTAPDVGADEFNGIPLDLSPPVISYTNLGNGAALASRSFTNVTVTDATGVNTTAGTRPRVYYKKSCDANNTFNDNTSATVGWKFAEANGAGSSPFDFTIDYSRLPACGGGSGAGVVAIGDVIQYFVVAQDTITPTPNVGINSGTFAATPSSVALTAAAFPIGGTINSYNIVASISGTKTVCASGCDYTTLTGATGIFKAINTGIVTNNLEIQINGDLSVEDGANGLNALAEEPSGSNFTVKIYPTGVPPRSITGSFAGALVRLNGASRVTIDGSIGGTGTDRSLTIQNTSTTTPSVVLLGSTGTTTITTDALKNCIIRNGVNTSSAVVISDSTTVGNPGFFSNITIQNNDIQKAFVGVFATGGTTPQNGSNLTYTQNTLSTSGANAIRNVGLYMQGVNGATVSQNTISNLSSADVENDVGIWLATGTINATVSGNTVSTLGYTGLSTNANAPIGINVTSGTTSTNVNVTGNNVSDITSGGTTAVRGIVVAGSTSDLTIQKNNVQGVVNTNTSTYGAYGMDISGGNNIVVKNNFVSNVNHNMSGGLAFDTTFGVVGIRVGAGTGIQVYDNSVNLYGPHTGTAATSLLSAAFALVNTTSTGCDVRDNIFANTITGGTTSIAHVSVFLPSAGTSAMNLTWNNNAYFNGTDAARQGLAQVGTTAGTGFYLTSNFNPAATTPSTNFRSYSSTLSAAATNDNASLASTSAAPFTTTNDLHIKRTAPATPAIVENVGAPIGSVTDDYDGDTRVATPDIGADETTFAGSLQFSAANYNDSETNATHNATITVTRTGGSDGAVSVHYATSNGTATTTDNDYTATSGDLNWANGDAANKTFTVSVTGDMTFEADETVNLTLSAATGGATIVTPNPAMLTIQNDDAQPSLSVNDVTFTGADSLVISGFTVTLSQASGLPVMVHYATSDNTAIAGQDYTAASGTLTFNPGDTTQQIPITILPDNIYEPTETFFVDLDTAVGATISDSHGVGTIPNDDTRPLPNIVYVDDDFTGPVGSDPAGPATEIGYDAFNTIQGGVNGVASGGTVNVAAGTYTENVTVTKPLTMTGAGAASVTVYPALSAANPCAGSSLCGGAASNIILVQADNVTISGMTLDGDNPSLTSGIVVGGADLDARNGIITNHTVGIFTNLTVHNMTVKNIYLRGIYASTGGDFNFHHCTVQNVQAEAASIAMFNFGGAGVFDHNNVSAANDAISSNHSRGVQFTNNTVTTSASAIHTDNAGDQGGSTPDTISDNTVTNSTVNGFGIWVFVPTLPVAVSNNTVTNVDVGLSAAGGNSTPVATTFSGNTVDGQNKANSTGVYLTTDQFGFGQGNNLVVFRSNTVKNNVDGFFVEANTSFAAGEGRLKLPASRNMNDGQKLGAKATLQPETVFTLTVNADFNRIVNNSGSGLTKVGAGTLVLNFENNWWGCNAGPNNAGCGAVSAGTDFDPWLVLGVSASPNPIPPGGTSTITADMTHNSDNAVPSATVFLPPTPVSFGATNGTVAPPTGTITNGQATTTFTSTSASSGSASATVDNQTASTAVNVTSPSLSVDDVTFTGADSLTVSGFTVTLTGTTPFPVTVHYATSDNTALAGQDYNAASGTLTFDPGDTSKVIPITILADNINEPTETFNVNLDTAVGATIGDGHGVGTIPNDDAVPVLSIDNQTVTEGNMGPTIATFTVTLTPASGQQVVVHYDTADGSATTADNDYNSASGDLTFMPGQTTKTIDVTVNGDTTYEANETFTVTLSSPVLATIGTGTGNGVINNDDAPPATLTVNTTDDMDFGFCLTSHCSLREAINAANANADLSTISFNIAGSGLHTISPTSALPSITAPVVIDGYMQPGASLNTLATGDDAVLKIELDGTNAGPSAMGLVVTGGGSAIKGLVINRFGSTAIHIQTNHLNAILGNFIGTNAAGDAVSANAGNGVSIANSNGNQIGSTNVADRNILSGNSTGIDISGAGATNNTVKGNYIGTDKTGTVDLGNAIRGVSLQADATNNTIGGSAAGARNVISGNDNTGVYLANVTGNYIQGNFIGTKSDGSGALNNGVRGILIFDGTGNHIGGSGAGEGNTIGFNGGNGVEVRTGTQNNILGNSIFANDGLGIDLNNDGVTPNDVNDGDTGPNNLQNFPVLNSAAVTGSTKTITGMLNSSSNTQYRLEFFSSPSCNAASPSDYGEGQTLIGSQDVTTVGNDVSFTFHPATLTNGQFITATATDPTGNTSEFSQCVAVNNGTAGTIEFTSATFTVGEGGGMAHITVKRTGGSQGSISATFNTSNGTATAGSDYTAVNNYTVTFADGDTANQTIDIPITDDMTYEGNETVNLSLGNTTINRPDGGIVAAVLTITENDAQPTLSVNDVTFTGADSITHSVNGFTVTLTGATSLPVMVHYATSDHTALAGEDYTATSGTLTFAPGETTKDIPITILGDTRNEPTEDFFVDLDTPVGATIGDGHGIGTIPNDDAMPTVSVNDFTFTGADSLVVNGFSVTLSAASGQTVTVHYATSDNTALAGEDYTATSGTLTFNPGDTLKVVPVTILADTVREPEETFFIDLDNPMNATLGDSQGIGTIPNDDPVPSITIGDVSKVERDAGNSNVTFTVTLSNPSSVAVTLNFATANGTATTASGDYTAASGPLTFNPGQVTRTFTVPVAGDIIDEGNETFFVNLTNPNNATISDATGVCTIIDDDINSGDFDGDGKNDLAVFRPNADELHIPKWYILNSADGSYRDQQFGLETDLPVAGDYDGDGKKEIAVWRPSNGTWYISNGSAQDFAQIQWGLDGDKPVEGDYDGDGKTDIAVFRPSDGIWYIRNSDGSLNGQQWGLSTDKPVPADYDGDGKTDLAVFRKDDPVAGSGMWYILRSSDHGFSAVQWGVNDDKLVPADYDLDGKADIAVWRPSDGIFYVLHSSDGSFTATQWGLSTDVPVVGDYDGDGKADIAVWRSSDSHFYILHSVDGTFTNPIWGLDGDIPVAARYVPEQ